MVKQHILSNTQPLLSLIGKPIGSYDWVPPVGVDVFTQEEDDVFYHCDLESKTDDELEELESGNDSVNE